jgi:hypothetical protein
MVLTWMLPVPPPVTTATMPFTLKREDAWRFGDDEDIFVDSLGWG